jgi:hypothetical protein
VRDDAYRRETSVTVRICIDLARNLLAARVVSLISCRNRGSVSVEGSGCESSDGGQDLVDRFCPTKGFGLFIVAAIKIPDLTVRL